MPNTLKASLQQSILEHIAKSSSLINQSGIKLQGDRMSYLLISINSTTSEKLYSTPKELNIREEESLNQEEENPKPMEGKMKCVGDSTVQKVVDSVKKNVIINTLVNSVGKEDIDQLPS